MFCMLFKLFSDPPVTLLWSRARAEIAVRGVTNSVSFYSSALICYNSLELWPVNPYFF